MKLVSVIFTTLAISSTVNAAEIGPIAIGGAGCFGSQKLITIDEQQGTYALPVRVRLNKSTTSELERKSCQVRIPIKLKQNEKLKISDASQSVRMLMHDGAAVKSTLEVSLVGQRTEPLVLEAKAEQSDKSLIEVVKKTGLIAESKCGKDTIVLANANLIATGTAKSFSTTGSLILKVQIVDCEN